MKPLFFTPTNFYISRCTSSAPQPASCSTAAPIAAKSAARIVLELKDKLKNQELVDNKKDVIKKVTLNNEDLDEAISALQVLGYNRKDVEKVFEQLDISGLKLEEIIKLGLKYLSRN